MRTAWSGMIRSGLLAAVLLLAAPAFADEPVIHPFRAGSYADLLAAHQEKPFLLVLWSVTCVPCREEFEVLRDLRKTNPQMALVLVSTDDITDRAIAAKVLERYGLAREESWIFADANAAKLRYEIDPAWYGEMPRSYFYDAVHRREAVSGSLKREQVEAWLAGSPGPG